MEPEKIVHRLGFPLIIAMKGNSRSNSSSIIGQKLAFSLEIPFIDENDVTQAILDLNSTKTHLSNELAHNLPFEVVCQIASTQLKLNIKLVINSSVFDTSRLNRLVQLALSKRARLIIIECNTEDKKDDYDARKIPKVKIDTESFDVKKVVSELSIMLSRMNTEELDKDIAESLSGDKNEIRLRQPTNDHLHELILYDKPRNDKLVCKCCSKLLLGSSYHCVECDEFTLHKSCAESAPNIDDSNHLSSFLTGIKRDHNYFQQTYKCNNCEEFLHDCCDCLLQTHISNRFVPTILNYKEHPHLLNFIIMPPRYNYQYQCCICDKLGGSVSYKCFECNDYNYDVHVNCVLQRFITMRNGQLRFFLTSISSPLEHTCGICNEKMEREQLSYRSEDPNLYIHFKCMPDESQADVLISKKNPKKVLTQEIGHIPKGERVYEYLVPASTWIKDHESVMLVVDLPDFKKEELKVAVTYPGNIKISGERPLGGYRWRRFEKELSVPPNFDVSNISAKFDGGALRIMQKSNS